MISQSAKPWAWIVLMMAFFVRALCLWVTGPNTRSSLNFDSFQYIAEARNLKLNHFFSTQDPPNLKPETDRTPGYPLFLVPFFRGGEIQTRRVQWAQALLGSFTAVFVFLIVFNLTKSVQIAFGSGIALSIDSVLIFHIPFILTETLFLFLWTWAFLALTVYCTSDKKTPRKLIEAGILIGVSFLVRPISLYYFVFATPLVFYSNNRVAFSRRTSMALIFLFASVLIPVCWMVRNGQEVGVYTFTTIQGENLHITRAAALEMSRTGKSQDEVMISLNEQFHKAYPGEHSVYEESTLKGQWAIKYILGHPFDYGKLLAKEFLKLMSGNSVKVGAWLLLKDPEYDPYRAPLHAPDSLWTQAMKLFQRHPIYGWLLFFYSIFFLTIYILAIIGFQKTWRVKGPLLASMLASPAVYTILVTLGSASQARYRIPAMPSLYVLAGMAFQKINTGRLENKNSSF